MSASPFSSFSSKEFQEKPRPLSGGSNLKPASPTPLPETTPAPGDANTNAFKTDVYRSYSLLDVAFWDFGKPAGGGTFLSRWFGSPKPAAQDSSNSQPLQKPSEPSQWGGGEKATAGQSSATSWGSWFSK